MFRARETRAIALFVVAAILLIAGSRRLVISEQISLAKQEGLSENRDINSEIKTSFMQSQKYHTMGTIAIAGGALLGTAGIGILASRIGQ